MPFRRLLLVLLLVLSQPAFATAVVGAMRVISTAEGVTVRVALSEPLPVVPKAFALNDPMRWAIDMRGASNMRWEAPGGGEAKNARISQFDPETVRLVVEFNQPMQLAEVFQDRGQALKLRFRPTDAAGFRQQVSRGRSDIAGFRQEVPFLSAELQDRIAQRLVADSGDDAVSDRATLTANMIFAVAALAIARASTGAHSDRDPFDDVRTQVSIAVDGFRA